MNGSNFLVGEQGPDLSLVAARTTRVGTIRLTLSCDSTGLSASLRSIADVLAATGGGGEAIAHFFDEGGVLRDDLGDLIIVEPVNAGATGTRKLEPIKLNPSDWYLEFVAALTGEGKAHIVSFVHGWPILSTVARTSVVAEAGDATSAPGGGAA